MTGVSDVREAESSSSLFLAPIAPEDEGPASLMEVVRLALGSIGSNKTRALLTTLGVIIGVMAVTTLLSLGEGVTSTVTSQLASMGTNTLYVYASADTTDSFASFRSMPELTMSDARALEAAQMPVTAVAPQASVGASLVAPAANTSASVVGTTPAYRTVGNLEVAEGSFITEDHVDSGSPVIVLGATLRERLFGSGEAIGQTVRVNGQTLTVIGVLAEQGGMGGSDSDGIVPITTLQQRLGGERTADGNDYVVNMVVLSARDQEDIPEIQARVGILLRKLHDLPADGSEDDFAVTSMAAIMRQAESILSTLTIFLSAIAAISLLVGGIGIMNIMLVSVTERTREIGLRKAVGARGSDIMLQFIVEALVISLMGGLIGLVLGTAATAAVSATGVLTASVTLSAASIAVGFSLAVGLFFGIYPAQRAARLDPIDALRHE